MRKATAVDHTSSLIKAHAWRPCCCLRSSHTRVCAPHDHDLPGEGSDEGTPASMGIPGFAETRSLIGVGHCDSRHGVRDLRERRIERNFVSAGVVMFAQSASLHSREPAGAERRDAVAFAVDDHLHWGGDGLVDVLKKFSTHVMGKAHQSATLLWCGLVI